MNLNHVLQIEGIQVAENKSFIDNRGSLIKVCAVKGFFDSLDSIVISLNPVLGTTRGLHFQAEPFAEEKIVTCIQGAIFDVVVDLREGSKTFGHWASIELNSSNALQVYIPKGIAHGFQTLSHNSIVHYGISAEYAPDFSYTINPFGGLNIEWPQDTKSISERDAAGVSFDVAAKKYSESLKI
jgi:dTDP-4-dehydrorhamnose 3,5-epimerase